MFLLDVISNTEMRLITMSQLNYLGYLGFLTALVSVYKCGVNKHFASWHTNFMNDAACVMKFFLAFTS